MDAENTSIGKFLDDMATKLPFPGCGCAAGLCGAMAASLVSMTALFTVENEKYMEDWPAMKEALARGRGLRTVFTRIVSEDADAVSFYNTTLTMPQKTEVEKSARRKITQDAIKMMTEVQLRMAEACVRLAEFALSAVEHGNPNLFGDAVAASALSETAARTAALNVSLNAMNVHDPVLADSYVLRAETALADVLRSTRKAADIAEKIKTKCNGRV